MAENNKKRAAGGAADDRRGGKRNANKSRKAYLSKVAISKGTANGPVDSIEAGISGIFASCEKGKEARSVTDLYQLFEKFAEQLYGKSKPRKDSDSQTKEGEVAEDKEEDDDDDEEDIEKALQRDLAALTKPEKKDKNREDRMFSSVKLSSPCLIFFKVKPPCNPVQLVDAICEHAYSKPDEIRYQRVQRLSPVTLTGKATLDALIETANTVLAPHFHQGQKGIKFAIQPTIRNHHNLTREEVIRTVASCVGPGHSVDLRNYDLLILVNIYKNTCGLSVVKDFEKYRKFSISQIIEYRKKEEADSKSEATEKAADEVDMRQEEAEKLEEQTKE